VKTISTAEARARFDTLLDELQRAPLLIRDQGRDVAVVLSIADDERLRAGAVHAFLELRNEIASRASAAGLTEERLTELLGED
jgi:PHD/YefM family antitoxin component YafN of YafNO toxin-antitoxin module